MKTPKRYMNKPLPMLPEDNVVDDWVIEIWCARAKRKNRIAQYKRSLHRYKHGTNLGFYCHEWHAYKRLQDLRKPGKKAKPDDWSRYMKELQQIKLHISHASRNAEIRRKELEQNND